MNQQLSRLKLIELRKAFDCPEWVRRINKYLSDTSFESDSFLVNISDIDLSYAESSATGDQKAKLIAAGIKFATTGLLNSVSTMDDIWLKLGVDPKAVLPFDESRNLSKRQRSANAFIKIGYISEYFNQGWIPDFANRSQYKYYNWFERAGSGWVFGICYDGFCCGGCGFGCYFRSSEIATHVGKKFIDVYRDYLPE